MQDPTATDDGCTDTQTQLSASEFGLSDDDLDALLDAVESGPDIDDLLDAATADDSIDDLLDAATGDDGIDELLDEVSGDEQADELADHYSEQAARQWGTPEGEWWP